MTNIAAAESLAWIPEGPGKWSRPLEFLGDRGIVELLRLKPGASVALHRHTGEVHSFTLAGRRQLRSGELIAAGEYVYEPPGNIDSWVSVGDEELIVFVVVMGEVHYLDGSGNVSKVVSAETRRADFESYCRQARAGGRVAADRSD